MIEWRKGMAEKSGDVAFRFPEEAWNTERQVAEFVCMPRFESGNAFDNTFSIGYIVDRFSLTISELQRLQRLFL